MEKLRGWKKHHRGFTLIELLIVLAILAVLAAIVIPNLVGFVGRGEKESLDGDRDTLALGVDAFYSDIHAGVAGGYWGKGDPGHWYPTEDGTADILELSTTQFDPDFPDNPRIKKYKEGPGDNGDAGDSQIEDAAIWIGLLVNEPFGTAGTSYSENRYSGTAHPMEDERGMYVKEFPESAAEINTDTDSNHTNGNGLTDGSYTWVVLYDGNVVPAYKSGGKWYAGYMGVYP
jgi:prepilin-type N-terminal cleavage/methylation domain-containing protein